MSLNEEMHSRIYLLYATLFVIVQRALTNFSEKNAIGSELDKFLIIITTNIWEIILFMEYEKSLIIEQMLN